MSGKRILVGEDNPETAELIQAILSRTPFRFDIEKTGESVLALYHAAKRDDDPYDLLFLDDAMPMKTGTTVLEEIRAEGNQVPAIFCTARAAYEIEPEARRLGARVVYKPFGLQQMAEEISSALGVKC